MPNKEVIGYYTNWLNTNPSSLRYDALSTIAWAFMSFNADGSLVKQSYPPTSLISIAHSYSVKVVISVNPGWGSPTIDLMLSNPQAQQTLVNNLLSEVQQQGFDGVDIDLEGFPATNTTNNQSNRTLFTNFMQLLSTTFWNANPNYRLSVAIPAVDWNNVFDTSTIQYYVNYIMIMGYDYHWQTGPTAGAVAPLTSPNGISVTDSINTYLSFISKNKLLLGVPYYGYEWVTQTSQPDSPASSGIAVTYTQVIDTKLPSYSRQWNNEWQTPYYITPNGQGWYDDSQSLSLKYDLINNIGLAGIGIWALGYDVSHNELADLILTKFGTGTPPPTGTTPPPSGTIPITQNKILLAGIGFIILFTLR